MITNIITLFSCLLLFCFITLGIGKFGILSSYSSYSTKWKEICNFPLNVWSLVTFIAASMLIPILLNIGENNTLQFSGFFAPAYLMFVACTPNWESNKFEHIMHSTFADICAGMGLIFIIFVTHLWYVLIISLCIMLICALLTKTLKYAYIFWLEMIMFLSIYISILLV